MTVSTTRAALLCALLATSALATPAAAQSSVDQPTPPRDYTIDDKGVDLATGRFYLSTTDVTIGANGGASGGGLSYSRNRREDGYDDIYLTALNISGGVATVSIGATSDTLPSAGGGSSVGTGAVLTPQAGGLYLYTLRDGTAYLFDPAVSSQRFRLAQQRATRISYPDGRVVTIDYDLITTPFCKFTNQCYGNLQSSRPNVISSTDGYRLVLAYESNAAPGTEALNAQWMTVASATASNTAQEYCDTSNCTSGTWRKASYAWNAASSQETRTDAMGRQSVITSDAGGRITGIRPPGASANAVSIGYTAAGLVDTVTNGSGVWHYGYVDDATYRTTTVTSPTGLARVAKSLLATGRIVEDHTGTGGTIHYDYDSEQRLKTVTWPEGNHADYAYDARDNLTSVVTSPKSGGTGTITVSASYPATCVSMLWCNKPTSTTDARGHTTDYTYDPVHGGVTSVTLPAPAAGGDRPQTRYGYTALTARYKDAGGSVVAAPSAIWKLTSVSQCSVGASPACVGTAAETRTLIDYGDLAQATNLLPASVTVRSGDTGTGAVSATRAVSYNAYGDVTAADGPLAGTDDTAYARYDADREVVGTISPDPDGAGALKRRAVRIGRDAAGRVTTVEQGTVLGTSDADWNAFASLQRLTSSYDPTTRLKVQDSVYAGGTPYALVQYGYDGDARPTCTVQRIGLANGGDPCVQLGDAGGYDRTAATQYGPDGRVAHVIAGGLAVANYTYTLNGQVATLRDAKNNPTTYRYDAFDRLDRTTHADTSYEEQVLDAGGLALTTRKRDGSTIANAYDDLGRLTGQTLPAGAANANPSYAYDLFGRLTSASSAGASAPWQNAATFDYDALGRLVAQGATTGGVGPRVNTFAYDAAGQRTSLGWPGGFHVDYDHLLTGEVSKVRENGAVSGIGVLATYTYDDLGNRRTLTRGNGTTTSWTPDAGSRLTAIVHALPTASEGMTATLAYDGVSRIRTRTLDNDAYAAAVPAAGNTGYASNMLNQYSAFNGQNLSYDPNGNQTTGSTGTTFGYNAYDQLVSTGAGAALAYDALGRLAYTAKAGSPTTRYDYDGQDLITELDASGNVLRRYVHGPGTDEPLVWYEGAGAGDRRWLHADERGSVVAVTGGTGARIALNTYDAFGQPGSGNSGRFQYTGQTWLPEVGLYYYKARMYDPKIGRFLQPDPIGVAGGVNLYAYAGNDPVNATDPSGLACRSVEATGIIDESTGNSYNSTVVCDGGGGSPSFPPFGFPGGGIDYGREFGNGGDGGPAPVVPDIIEMTPEPQSNQKKVDCNSTARQIAKTSSVISNGFGTSAAVLGVLGAEPAAAFLGGVAVAADLGAAAAGVYVYATEGDSSILFSSVTGKALGVGASLYTRAAGAIYGFTPSSARKIAMEYAGEQLGGAVPYASVCPN